MSRNRHKQVDIKRALKAILSSGSDADVFLENDGRIRISPKTDTDGKTLKDKSRNGFSTDEPGSLI